jgi:8-oxo-dGTP pyrophosphatase MutT (NUDIX family)
METPDEDPPVRVVRSDTVYRAANFRVVRDVQEWPDGRHSWESVEFGGSALVLPIDRDGYVYLVDQYRPLLGRRSLEVVGGRIDAGESPEAAARRELREEAGIEARLIALGTPELSTAAVRCREHLFVAMVESIGAAHPEPFERRTLGPTRRLRLDEAVGLVLDGEIVALATMTLILLAAEHRRRGRF